MTSMAPIMYMLDSHMDLRRERYHFSHRFCYRTMAHIIISGKTEKHHYR